MRILTMIMVLASTALAEDGAQSYTLYCSACHGADGKGATGGQFPPLAQSPWVLGNHERSVRVVLHGLHGPVDVLGKTYNLEMPPQGAALKDSQIAAILTHVRSSWGNKESAVTEAMVADVRKANASRDKQWTAEELLKLFPLENQKATLSNMISHYYQGSFNAMPDFSTLKPSAVEEEPSGIIAYHDYANIQQLAMTWDADWNDVTEGVYEFFLDSDDGSRLLIDGNLVCEIKTTGPQGRTVTKKVEMKGGNHKIRVEYFEVGGNKALSVGYRLGPKGSVVWLSKDKGQTSNKTWPEIMLAPKDGRTAIYRNFIQGTTARGVGVGFSNGCNMAYSADHCAPELMWKGLFIDAGHHWTDRGIGSEPPAEPGVPRISNAVAWAATSSVQQDWPAEAAKDLRFRGYQLSAKGDPTFAVELGGSRALDRYNPISDGVLERTLKLTKNGGAGLTVLLAAGGEVQLNGDVLEAGGMKISIKGAAFRKLNNAVAIDLSNAPVVLTYRFE